MILTENNNNNIVSCNGKTEENTKHRDKNDGKASLKKTLKPCKDAVQRLFFNRCQWRRGFPQVNISVIPPAV